MQKQKHYLIAVWSTILIDNIVTNEEYQKQLEEHHIIPIIRYLGIDLCNVEIDDKPDVVIKDYEGKIIGVENVEYHSNSNILKTNSRLDDICDEYEQMLRERGEKGFQLNVHFSEYVYSLKRINSKDVIDDIEYSRKYGHGTKFVWYTMRSDGIPDDVRVLQMGSGFISDEIDYSIIRKKIEIKDAKLKEYKQLEKNKNIDEYWLNINIPYDEYAIYKPDDTLNIESKYNRIYLSTYELGDAPLRIK